MRVFSIAQQFDLDNYENERTISTRTRDSNANSVDSWTEWNRASPLEQRESISRLEQPYHVFSQKEIWSVVVVIGAAGLFSGLSSNIYFPALDAIAKV